MTGAVWLRQRDVMRISSRHAASHVTPLRGATHTHGARARRAASRHAFRLRAYKICVHACCARIPFAPLPTTRHCGMKRWRDVVVGVTTARRCLTTTLARACGIVSILRRRNLPGARRAAAMVASSGAVETLHAQASSLSHVFP